MFRENISFEIEGSRFQSIEDQRAEAETLRLNYSKLQQKLQDTAARCDLLLVQHHRSRATGKANKAQSGTTGPDLVRSIDRMRGKIMRENAVNTAHREVEEEFSTERLEDRFRKLEREDKIQQLLEDLKSRRAKSA
ncbi:MAG: PspA/IM30 family protein [Acidobacteria bacterium]|nr:PspA/IM30 family protein [Acidobacteriota bacterium]